MTATPNLAAPRKATPVTLERLGRAWAKDSSRGLAYIQGMTAWLSGYSNPHTRRANAYSVTEFFDWFEAVRRKGRGMPMPHEVTREDANAYAKWLHQRTVGLDELRLRRDPSQALEAAVYAHVRSMPGCTFDSIRAALLSDQSIPTVETADGEEVLAVEEQSIWGLDLVLAKMVERKLLKRTPTMAELRKRGLVEGVDWSRAGLDFRPEPSTYRYTLDAHTDATGEDRASTALRRLATLSSLWRHWAERGENTDGSPSLLRFNIWSPLVREEADLAPSRQKAYRQSHTPSLEHWQALMATTESRSIDDVRDRAILCLLFWQALRVQELCGLRRKDRTIIDGVECIRVRRKNGKVQNLVLEPEALAAINALEVKLLEFADAEEARAKRKEDPTIIGRWTRLLDNPDGPLIPALRRWGVNASDEQEERPISRQAVAMMLGRRSALPLDATDPQSDTVIPEADWPKIHAHGFRHLAAKEARRAGADVAIIQASLGHESLATTTRYVEEHDMRRIRLFSNVDRSQANEARSKGQPPRRKSKGVIDAKNAEVDDTMEP